MRSRATSPRRIVEKQYGVPAFAFRWLDPFGAGPASLQSRGTTEGLHVYLYSLLLRAVENPPNSESLAFPNHLGLPE